MIIKLLKIPDNFTVDDHKKASAHITNSNDIDGLSLSIFGGVHGPVWKNEVEYNLNFLESYAGISSLEIFLPNLNSLNPITLLSNDLKFISIGECRNKHVSLSPLRECRRIESLGLVRNKTDFDVIGGLKSLDRLSLTGYQEKDLQVVTNLKQLRRLSISFGTAETLDFISSLKAIEILNIIWVKKLCDIDSIKALESLKMIELSHLKCVSHIPDLLKLTHLKSIVLNTMNGLDSVNGLCGSTVKELAILNSKLEPNIFENVGPDLKNLETVLLGLKSKTKTKQAKAYFPRQALANTLNDLSFYNQVRDHIEYCSL